VARPLKTNCWELKDCGYGPKSAEPCPAATDATSHGTNRGINAGRICWTVPGTLCDGFVQGTFHEKQPLCLSCGFIEQVRREEGEGFRFLKLARGVSDPQSLRAKLGQVEALEAIHEELSSRFDLDRVLADITQEVERATHAQRSLVLLRQPDPSGEGPAQLRGRFALRRKEVSVAIPIDDTSAVGCAALNNVSVNVRDPYNPRRRKPADPPFSKRFDRACRCRTRALLAVPIRDAEDQAVGVITAVNSDKGYFSQDDQWFLEHFAVEASLALEKDALLKVSLSTMRLASIGETVAALSHCIKNIAHTLRGSSYIIKRGLERNRIEDVRSAWELLDRHVELLADLVSDVLAEPVGLPARVDAFVVADLNETVRNAVRLFEAEARARAVDLVLKRGRGLRRCRFSKRGVYRAVVNLVVNALESVPHSGGQVVVATRKKRSGEAVISVSDSGSGMDERTRQALLRGLLDPRKTRGTGLGLVTVRSIVERHRGHVTIESKPGKGSCFSIYLPAPTT